MSKLGPIAKGNFTERAGFIATTDGEGDLVITAGMIRHGKRGFAEVHSSPFSGFQDGYTYANKEENAANAALYADAHNTANRTGKLPSELEAERDELLEALKQVTDLVSGVRNQGKMPDGLDRAINIGRALIAKSTGK